MGVRRGALIVLEGVDRAGKTTQCKRLVQALRDSGKEAEMMRFPDRTTMIGQLISSYLEKKSNLEDHTGFSLEWCQNPDVGLPKPDLVMFLQVNPAEVAGRGGFGDERYETSVFQRAVQQKFEQLIKDPSVNWKVIDAARSIEDVHTEIKTLSENAINIAENQPIGELWK
ncbi:thymidylate kinase isoform X3 [Chanos chanos]|uniref:Thymidylate kinase isoform X3 n=1 Tax=Chanos chanos TaxID=29144 RepID=A0A6J2WTE0_CHACN|nr:thymidylate kinase isoform X3 [Chanos chanos]